MAKEKLEIATFTTGVNGSISETDTQLDAATFETNISATEEDGALRAIADDQVLSNTFGFQRQSNHKQTVTFLYGTPVAAHSIESMSAGTDDNIRIMTDATSHNLTVGDVVKFVGSAGTDSDKIDGYYNVTVVHDADEFEIDADFSDNVTSGEVTDGSVLYVLKQYASTRYFDYSSTYIPINFIKNGVEYNYYFWFDVTSIGIGGTDPATGNTDFDGYTGVEIDVAGGASKDVVASAFQAAVNGISGLTATVNSNIVTITCDDPGNCNLAQVSSTDLKNLAVQGGTNSPLEITSDIVTLAITQQGHGTIFNSDDFVSIKESRDVFTMFSIDYSADKIYRWSDYYGTTATLKEIESNVNHNNASSFHVRDKQIHLGLGGKEETPTKWIGKIDRTQLNNTFDDWYIEEDKLIPLSSSMAPLNFDIIVSTQLHNNSTAFNEEQSYHADLPDLSSVTMQAAFTGGSGAIYTLGDDDANDANQYGKIHDVIPGTGWCVRVGDTNYDDTGDILRGVKRQYYDDGASLVVGDVFMLVDNTAAATKWEFIGNTETKAPAFFIGATEGSNIIYKCSTTTSTDSDAFGGAGSETTKRYVQIDLSDILDDSGIATIAPCRTPLTSGYTVGKSSYMCYGDGTIDKEHIADQRCRALYGMYWITTLSGNMYRINLMDIYSQHSNDDYKGAKEDALMILDYSEIAKNQVPANNGNFKHMYGAIYGINSTADITSGNQIGEVDGFDTVSWVDNYASSWTTNPTNSNIVGIVETWNNDTDPSGSCAQNTANSRYVYDDDSDTDGAGANHYPNAGYTDHHHARKHGLDDFWTLGTDKTVFITKENHGVDVGNIITGFINGAGTKGHANYKGNTICNKVRGINNFSVIGTHPGSSGAQDDFPYYSCKVWVLFRRKNDSPYSRWDLMLYNFYPTIVQNNSALMYDRTPPYDEVDKSTFPEQTTHEDDWWDPDWNGVSEQYGLIQKSSQAIGNDEGIRPQNFSYPGSTIHDLGWRWAIQRRDGSAISEHFWRDSLVNMDFGRLIGWDGSESLDNIRVMTPLKQSLCPVYSQEETPSNYHALVHNEAYNAHDWHKTGNKHQVTFMANISGSLTLEGYQAYYRSTEGSLHINIHSGGFKGYNDSVVMFKVTDNGCLPQDTRMWMGHYEADSSINDRMAYHYSAGGRFKKRCIIKANGDIVGIHGSGEQSGDVNYYTSGTPYSTYDGSRMTNTEIPLSNGSITMYAGQTGDYMMIDRKWLSSEPKVGLTHERRLRKGAFSYETRGADNESHFFGDMQSRHYDSSGNALNLIRGTGGKFGNNNDAPEDAYDFPSGDHDHHDMSCRSMLIHSTNVISQHHYGGATKYGDENTIAGVTEGTGNNFSSSAINQTFANNHVYDLNRYPPSFEILYPHVAEMRLVPQNLGDYNSITNVQQLYNDNFTYDSEFMISGTILSNNETQSVITTNEIQHTSLADSDYANLYQSLYVSRPINALYNRASKTYPEHSKLLAHATVTNEDIAANNPWGHIWGNGGFKPATGTTNSQFIAPMDSDAGDDNSDGYDFDGETFASFKASTSDGYTVKASMVEISEKVAVSGSTEFPTNSNIKYKLSLLYDGYQESPLSDFFYDVDTSSAYGYFTIKLKILDTNMLSKRVSHINVYRKNSVNDLYRLVKEVDLDPSKWTKDSEDNYVFTFRDDKRFGSYSALNGIDENIRETSLNYEISTSINDSLFVAKAWHPELEDSEKYVFKSKPGNFSQFDYTKDYLVLNSIPVALKSYAGKIFAFDRSNMYRINPEGMFVEDVFEGIGCLSQDSAVVTEFGMCFADRNNIYLHDGTMARPIGNPILKATTYEGLKIGWQAAAKHSEDNGVDPFVFFDGETNSFVCFVQGSCEQNCAIDGNVSRAWVYNISRNRWDYWEAPQVLKATQGKDGDVLLSDNKFLYNYKKDDEVRDWTWLSKKLNMTKNLNDKRFHRIKMLGTPTSVTLSTPPKWNDDIVVYVDGEIQQLTKLNTKFTKSFAGCFLDFATNGPNWLTDSMTTLYLKGRNDDTDDFLGSFPTINTYVMVDDEIMLITAVDKVSYIKNVTVTRGQLGTTAVAHTITNNAGEGYEGQRLYYVSPTIKLPAKCKGKNIEVLLQNQKGVVDAIQIEYINKGRAK